MENHVLENFPLPIFILDKAEGRVVYLNRKFKNLFGYGLKDIPTIGEWNWRAYPDPVYRKQAADEILDDECETNGRAVHAREVLV